MLLIGLLIQLHLLLFPLLLLLRRFARAFQVEPSPAVVTSGVEAVLDSRLASVADQLLVITLSTVGVLAAPLLGLGVALRCRLVIPRTWRLAGENGQHQGRTPACWRKLVTTAALAPSL